MTEKDEVFDKELGDITERLVALGSPAKMKMAYDAGKSALKAAAKKPKISLLLLRNSAEMIAQLEEDYDFSGVSVKKREQAQKCYIAEMPSSSASMVQSLGLPIALG